MNPEDSSFENSRIERLKRGLYSRNESLVPKDNRPHIEHKDYEVSGSWGAPKSFEIKPDVMTKRNNSFFNKFLIFSLVVFLVSLAVALFIFLGGINMISSDNLDVKVVAPSSISSGEELLMVLNITNGNRTDLEEVALIIDYPIGSQDVSSTNKPLSRERIELGTIPNGGSRDYSVRTLLFGEKDSIKTFILNLEYKVKGSNATLLKEKTVDISIGSSPILMKINYPREINSGQEFSIVVDLTSNSPVVLKNSMVKIDYPYGFTYKSSSLKPVRDNSVWNVGDLKDGDQKTFNINGVLVGQNMEDRSFRISAGTQTPGLVNDFDSDLVEEFITVGIRKSFYDLRVTTTDDAVKNVGEYTPVIIKWRNTTPDRIFNTRIEAKISGNILDRNNVGVANNGFYESINSLVLWDKNGVKELAQMMPGAEGQVSVTLISLSDPATVRSVKDPNMNITVVIKGSRSDDDSSEIISTESLLIKIQSDLSIISRSLRKIGPFTNTGLIPPKADKETTYTVTWTVSNTTNDLRDAEVTATLPVGVSWKGEISPTSERIGYNPDNRTITWKIGNISAGIGHSYPSKEVSFKVGIIPSINQIGSSPILVSRSTVTALDTYTNTTVRSFAESVSTQFSDPDYRSGENIVGQ